MESSNFAHSKVAEVEKENSGVEAAHKTEQSGEDVYRFFKGHYKGKTERRRAKAAKLEKKQMQKEVNFRYQKFLEENPEMQEKTIQKQLQKRLQKQRIKREYAKARRAGQTAKAAKETAAKSGNLLQRQPERYRRLHQKCFASACHRSLFGASCDDYDSSIFLWGDVCRRNQYHAGRKLYERSGRNRCGRFSFF